MARPVMLAFAVAAAVVVVCLYSLSPVAASPVAGGWSAVKGAYKVKEVQDLAKFAVKTHNNEKNTNLQYHSVKAAWRQVVAGLKWRIELRAFDPARATKGRVPALYVAEIWEKPWEDFRQLLTFKEATN
ncbi:hypothetical protein CLOM_g8664 [Closterium sp. NIES-68]|nr:hypothetical protein CLOM_g8664 [Closterium sp. NIES-68]GJP80125.1 hypothetical protein CLOP_g10353 [Closterium sp. NIES-67]